MSSCSYLPGARIVLGPFFERGSGPITIGDVQCSGTELRLFDCPNGGIGGYMGRCTHRNDAGVICQLSKLEKKNNVL